MAVNKVVCSGWGTLLDLTSDTITSDMMFSGYTAHAASGEVINGTLDILDLTWDDLSSSKYNGDDTPYAPIVGRVPNKIMIGSRVLISLLDDTASSGVVIAGITFHHKSGVKQRGTRTLSDLTWNQYSNIVN